jgi:hypothetical protein
MADLRSALTEALSSAETVETPVVETPVVQEAPIETQEARETRERDEAGRFVAKTGEAAPSAAPSVEPDPVEAPPQIQRPSTWKKEYWPLYDKLATGQALTPDEAKRLADYTNQRENEFKGGVSTYKAEADKAKEINEAIAPFLPELQIHGIQPGQWIANLGRAHYTLAKGSPQEKLAMFHRLANEYGVDIGQERPQVDPQMQWVSQELNQIRSAWTQFQSEQQKQAQESMQRDIQTFASAHPHFEAVRDQMAGLLQSGLAQNLDEAYTKAIRMNGLQEQPTQQPAANSAVQAADAVAKARAKAISPKSASPSASVDAKPKGLRAVLENEINSALGGGRV